MVGAGVFYLALSQFSAFEDWSGTRECSVERESRAPYCGDR